MRSWHAAVRSAKTVIYGSRGEPYHFGGRTLRFVPGTRPIRTRYANSSFEVNRYDALTVLWLEKHLHEGDTGIDVGAHFGVFALLMAAKCKRVVAFEPDPEARQMLQRNITLNASLKPPIVESYACSDAVGEATFYNCHGNMQSALFESSPAAEATTVKTVTLDSYLAAHDMTPSCVKIDAEGAEIRILKGARNLLVGDAHVVCELHPSAWTYFRDSFDELRSLLHDCGRRIRYLDQRDECTKDPTYGVAVLERSQAHHS